MSIRFARSGAFLFCACLLLSSTPVPATPAAQPAAQPGAGDRGADPSRAVQRLIIELDSPSAAIRRTASLQLNSLGAEALPAVEAALKDGDAGPEALLRLERAAKFLRPRARRDFQYKACGAWEVEGLHAAYNNGGFAGGEWDVAAHRAINAHVRVIGGFGYNPLRAPAALRKEALDAFQEAIDKGCQDPLVRVMYHFTAGDSVVGANIVSPLRTTLHEDVVSVASLKSYPPQAKYYTLVYFYWQTFRPEGINSRLLAEYLREIAATDGVPDGEVDRLVQMYLDALGAASDAGVPNVFEKRSPNVVMAYQAIAPNKAGPILARARVALETARKMRGQAKTVQMTAAELKLFKDRLAEAEQLLEAAWQLDPSDTRSGTYMVLIKTGQGEEGGGRDAMEKWFKRAMEADPDNVKVCKDKLNYLSKSPEDAIAFGRECLQTENWRAGLPFILLDAHLLAANESGDWKEYFDRPDVWADLQATYDGAVLNFPADDVRRSHYAKVAATLGRWEIAREQFEALGDRAVISVFGSKTNYDYLRKKTARMAREKSASSSPSSPTTRPAVTPTTRPAGRP